ncbi:hypothetical protein [Streptomyces sp. NPDC048473]|uniref:hypothetical protein n=1 Tax=unclassified Streptomyces TaxID=2593676 RepID=UPI00370FE703
MTGPYRVPGVATLWRQDLVFGLETTASRIAHLVTVDALTQTLLTLRATTAERTLHLSADVTADHSY